MLSQMLQAIDGVTIYPIISLLFFFIFFVAMLTWVMKMDKRHMNKMSQLPLDEVFNISKNGDDRHVG